MKRQSISLRQKKEMENYTYKKSHLNIQPILPQIKFRKQKMRVN